MMMNSILVNLKQSIPGKRFFGDVVLSGRDDTDAVASILSCVYHLVTHYVQGSQIQNLVPTRLSGKVRQQCELIPDPANSHSYVWSGVVLSEQNLARSMYVVEHPKLSVPTLLSLQQLKAFIAPAPPPPPSCWPSSRVW